MGGYSKRMQLLKARTKLWVFKTELSTFSRAEDETELYRRAAAT